MFKIKSFWGTCIKLKDISNEIKKLIIIKQRYINFIKKLIIIKH